MSIVFILLPKNLSSKKRKETYLNTKTIRLLSSLILLNALKLKFQVNMSPKQVARPIFSNNKTFNLPKIKFLIIQT